MVDAAKSLQCRSAAHVSWSRTADPARRTAPARQSFLDRFEREVDPEGDLPIDERIRRAAHARRAYFVALAAKSASVRRQRRTSAR